MKKIFFMLLFSTMAVISFGQYIEIDHSNSNSNFVADRSSIMSTEPELFKNGFVDFLSNGSLQASARVLRLHIGEPAGFNIPLVIYSGVAGQTFGENKYNKTTVANLLNQAGGIINGSFYKTFNIQSPGTTYTKLRFDLQLGGRLVNGTDTTVDKNTSFFNGYANAGLFFQTGAWEETSSTVGIFWLQAKLMAASSSKVMLEKMFGTIEEKYLFGYSLDAGLEIDGLINLKLSYYKYANNNSGGILDKPVFKVSLDYNLKK